MDYLSEFDFVLMNKKLKLLQWEFYETMPVIPIIYPQSHWGFRDDISGYDTLLLSQTRMEWEHLRKGNHFPIYSEPYKDSGFPHKNSSNKLTIDKRDGLVPGSEVKNKENLGGNIAYSEDMLRAREITIGSIIAYIFFVPYKKFKNL